MHFSSKAFKDSFDLLLSNPSLMVPVFLEGFFLFAILVASLFPLFMIAGVSFLSNWAIFFSALPSFLLFSFFVSFVAVSLAVLAVSFCRSLFLSMAKQVWDHGFCSLENAFEGGTRYMWSLFSVTIIFYSFSAMFLASACFFFFSALISFSIFFVFSGLLSFLFFCFVFFSFFWRHEAVLLKNRPFPALDISISSFSLNKFQTVHLCLTFFLFELFAGFLASYEPFAILSFFLGLFVSAYIRMCRFYVFFDPGVQTRTIQK